MKGIIYDKETFLKVIETLNAPKNLDYQFLYGVYKAVSETIIEVMNSTEGYNFTPLNPVTVILYIINEYAYATLKLDKNSIYNLSNDEKFSNLLASTCADKYITNEQLSYKSQSYLNRFSPSVSTLSLYLNFILRSLESIKTKNQYNKLVSDMLKKAFSMGKCILNLLIDGFETEAFSTWRTLHENECILMCLIKYGEPIFKAYFRHVTYAIAYRKQIKSKEETDKIFEEIKFNMKEHDLKSKDMKKYIEYGYLFAIKNINLNTDFKLNFRDGVEKLAGLSEYSKVYEMSSEISHSSPLLLYSKKEYYYAITIINLYESFFRLEKIFEEYYKQNVEEKIALQYSILKATYLRQLHYIHQDFSNSFKIGPEN
ncbi:MAG TPA: hypothetical protein DEA28_04335 [Firmicutes bacterium]|nr:hypothetical protein [Bacillota bacterium]